MHNAGVSFKGEIQLAHYERINFDSPGLFVFVCI